MRRRTAKTNPRPFQEWTYKDILPHHEYDGRPLKVEAFVCSCGGKFLKEIEHFLCCIRARYPDNPIYMMCDEAGYERIQEVKELWGFENIIAWNKVDESYAKKIRNVSKNVVQRSDYWNIDWIYAKMDALLRAVLDTNEKGVIMLDSDIILNERIDTVWEADAVISAHSFTNPLRHGHKIYGFFNAGMFLTNRAAVVRDWMNLFLKGGPDNFYEQTPLETLTKRWACEFFPEAHNFGQWRREDLNKSKRVVKSFHKHPNETSKYPEQKAWWKQADQAVEDAKSILRMPHRKIVFAGNKHDDFYVSELKSKISRKRETEVLYQFGRSWHSAELGLIARGLLHGLENRRNQIVICGEKQMADVNVRHQFEEEDWLIVHSHISKYTIDDILREYFLVN